MRVLHKFVCLQKTVSSKIKIRITPIKVWTWFIVTSRIYQEGLFIEILLLSNCPSQDKICCVVGAYYGVTTHLFKSKQKASWKSTLLFSTPPSTAIIIIFAQRFLHVSLWIWARLFKAPNLNHASFTPKPYFFLSTSISEVEVPQPQNHLLWCRYRRRWKYNHILYINLETV